MVRHFDSFRSLIQSRVFDIQGEYPKTVGNVPLANRFTTRQLDRRLCGMAGAENKDPVLKCSAEFMQAARISAIIEFVGRRESVDCRPRKGEQVSLVCRFKGVVISPRDK